MTINKEGLLIFFDEDLRNEFLKEREEGGFNSFTDALSVYDWKVRKLQVALLSFTGSTIDYIALASKGNRVVTAKSRIEFSELFSIDSVLISEIESLLETRIRNHFIKSSQGHGGRLPEKTWIEIVDAIKKLRPQYAEEIDRIISMKEISQFHLRGPAAELLLQEREALGIALDIFDGGNKIRGEVLGSWAPNIGDVSGIDQDDQEAVLEKLPAGRANFMAGIPKRYIQEESAIQHDLFNWDGMSPFHELGTSKFIKGNRILEVIYANKNSLENTTGADLIYYIEKYHAFILVQYKLMKKKGDEHVYRPNKQLLKEIQRMDKFVNTYCNKSAISEHEEYRLCDDGFLLKLVPNSGLMPASKELIKGMYITRIYMKFLLSAKGPKGEKGGTIITFDNSPRYLTNTEFSKFINRGWIGTRGIQSDILSKLIKQYYETGNAILFANETEIETY